MNNTDSGFDYKIIAACQYGVYSDNEVVDCGEPATHRVWWADDASDAIFVCAEHFRFIRDTE